MAARLHFVFFFLACSFFLIQVFIFLCFHVFPSFQVTKCCPVFSAGHGRSTRRRNLNTPQHQEEITRKASHAVKPQKTSTVVTANSVTTMTTSTTSTQTPPRNPPPESPSAATVLVQISQNHLSPIDCVANCFAFFVPTRALLTTLSSFRQDLVALNHPSNRDVFASSTGVLSDFQMNGVFKHPV